MDTQVHFRKHVFLCCSAGIIGYPQLLTIFFSTYLSIYASISSVIVAKPTTPPIVLVPPESGSLEVAQTQVSREFHDNLSVNRLV